MGELWGIDRLPINKQKSSFKHMVNLLRFQVIGIIVVYITHWPARSPDLTSADLFLWGYIKGNVY